jgi:hypothetical protein
MMARLDTTFPANDWSIGIEAPQMYHGLLPFAFKAAIMCSCFSPFIFSPVFVIRKQGNSI